MVPQRALTIILQGVAIVDDKTEAETRTVDRGSRNRVRAKRRCSITSRSSEHWC